MSNRIHILGASGSGTLTLGSELSLLLPYAILDSDDYFWAKKFSKQREPKDRIQLLKEDLSKYNQWILSGAVCGWGDDIWLFFSISLKK
jgi:adenylate kinase family enzyme